MSSEIYPKVWHAIVTAGFDILNSKFRTLPNEISANSLLPISEKLSGK